MMEVGWVISICSKERLWVILSLLVKSRELRFFIESSSITITSFLALTVPPVYAKTQYIYCVSRHITMNSLSVSLIHLKSTIFFAKSLWIHYRSRKFTILLANSPWIHFFSRDHYEYIFIFFVYSLSSHVLWFFYEFTIFFAISLWIHVFPEINMNSLSAPLNPFISAKSLWIHFLLGDITLNSLSFSRNQFEFIICFGISLLIHYLFREFTMNSVWNHYETTMKSLWIHYLFANSLSVSPIHYLFRKFALNPLSFLRNRYEFTILFTLSL